MKEEKQTYEQILGDNIKYIYAVANSLGFNNDDLIWDDLIQIGRIELYRSWQVWNPTLNSGTFMKFAGYNIRHQMKTHLSNNLRTIRIPYSILQQELKKEYSERDYHYKMASTDRKINEKGSSITTIGDTLIDIIEVEEVDSDDKEILYKAISMLKPKYRRIIEMYYGINQINEEGHSLTAIGKRYGETKENIRTTKVRAEKELKKIIEEINKQ